MFIYINKDDLRAIELSKFMSEKNYYVSCDFKDIKYADIVYLGIKGIDRKNRLNCFDETIVLNDKVFASLKENCCVVTLVYNEYLKELSDTYHFRYCALNNNEYFVRENTMLCGEGIICYIIKNRPFSLVLSRIIIFGSGHIATYTSKLLSDMGVDVTICSRKEVSIKKVKYIHLNKCQDLKEYDVIINTVPSQVINHSLIDSVKSSSMILDVSSFPYGLDHHYALNQSKNTYILSGIPGKYAYKYGAEIIMKCIEDEYNDM